jgi:hypothetical protein
MRHRDPETRRCSYLVVIERDREVNGDLRELATYLSTLTVAGCEVIVVDDSPAPVFESHRRVLRWVSRHIAARPRHRSFSGTIDVVRTAIDVSTCDKVIVAEENVRYDSAAIGSVCEAGRMLVHRGVEPLPDHGATFGMRRSTVRGLRGVDVAWSSGDDPVRHLTSQGAEVFSACDVFVRRLPPPLINWLHDRPKQAGDDFAIPVKTAFFFALLPTAMLLAVLGGMRLAGGYAGAIAFASLVLAVRGRAGTSTFFPLRACLSAPLWVLERSISVYWALLQRLNRSSTEAMHPSTAERGARAVASGER